VLTIIIRKRHVSNVRYKHLILDKRIQIYMPSKHPHLYASFFNDPLFQPQLHHPIIAHLPYAPLGIPFPPACFTLLRNSISRQSIRNPTTVSPALRRALGSQSTSSTINSTVLKRFFSAYRNDTGHRPAIRHTGPSVSWCLAGQALIAFASYRV